MAGRRHAPGRWARWMAVAVAAVLVSACSASGTAARPAGSTVPTVASTVATTVEISAPTSTIAAAPTTALRPPTSTATSTVPTTAAVGPASTFTGTVSTVTAAELPSSWRPGCPVGPEALRLLRVSYWGFDDQPHVGAIVVAESVTAAVLEVFRTLYDQRFPIRRMEPVDAYGGDDDASMAVDNTSGFNCRNAVSSGPPHWSNHAYGLAIDVNPIENPYLLGSQVLPPAGADYADRSPYRPGMAVAGGVLTSAFDAVGWGWGGYWDSPDYQHFSSTGG